MYRIDSFSAHKWTPIEYIDDYANANEKIFTFKGRLRLVDLPSNNVIGEYLEGVSIELSEEFCGIPYYEHKY